MKKIRTISLILVILILAVFLVMSGALLMQNYNLFFIAGSVLIALLLVAFLVLRFYKTRVPQEKEEEDAPEVPDTLPAEEPSEGTTTEEP